MIHSASSRAGSRARRLRLVTRRCSGRVLARGGLIAEVGGALGKGSAMNATRGAKTIARSQVAQAATGHEDYRLGCLYSNRTTRRILSMLLHVKFRWSLSTCQQTSAAGAVPGSRCRMKLAVTYWH
jgi:hypothetical protein